MLIKVVFAIVLVAHGLIHLMGAAKAFGLADLPALTQPISRPMGLAWLLASAMVLASAAALFAWPRGWIFVAVLAAIVSQAVILTAWADARFGTLANVLLLAGATAAWLSPGP
ncbi:MAG: hypothetical protein AB7H88_17735 [Vicinamibacterales bacterium]